MRKAWQAYFWPVLFLMRIVSAFGRYLFWSHHLWKHPDWSYPLHLTCFFFQAHRILLGFATHWTSHWTSKWNYQWYVGIWKHPDWSYQMELPMVCWHEGEKGYCTARGCRRQNWPAVSPSESTEDYPVITKCKTNVRTGKSRSFSVYNGVSD